MTRNLISPEQAEANRERCPGGYTFHAPIATGYSGIAFLVVCVRLGDHAHLEVSSGRCVVAEDDPDRRMGQSGVAGRLILRWNEWEFLRDALDAVPWVRIAEMENPDADQLRKFA